jgi:hypothetical protein
MARVVDTIIDQTSTAAGTTSFSAIDIARYEMVTVWFIGIGAAAPTSTSVTLVAADGTSMGSSNVTVAIGGKSPVVLGAVPASGVTNAVAMGPVTPKLSATATGGAASTVRLLVHGVRPDSGSN